LPLIKFDLIEGRTDAELKELLDAAHRAVVQAFGVPEKDRYQIVYQHPANEMVIDDTGLGLSRSRKLVVISITSKARTDDQKKALYRLLTEELGKSCGIRPDDIMVSITSNSDADWSFGLGEAQFLTGAL
jgi:Tautomerase enzyme.